MAKFAYKRPRDGAGAFSSIRIVSKAKESEDKGRMGHALTLYVNAQSMYPPSRIANDAIKRLVDTVLGEPKDTGA